MSKVLDTTVQLQQSRHYFLGTCREHVSDTTSASSRYIYPTYVSHAGNGSKQHKPLPRLLVNHDPRTAWPNPGWAVSLCSTFTDFTASTNCGAPEEFLAVEESVGAGPRNVDNPEQRKGQKKAERNGAAEHHDHLDPHGRGGELLPNKVKVAGDRRHHK